MLAFKLPLGMPCGLIPVALLHRAKLQGPCSPLPSPLYAAPKEQSGIDRIYAVDCRKEGGLARREKADASRGYIRLNLMMLLPLRLDLRLSADREPIDSTLPLWARLSKN